MERHNTWPTACVSTSASPNRRRANWTSSSLRQEYDGRLVTHANFGGIATWHCNDVANAEVKPEPHLPDGICLDAAGAIWVADAGGNCVTRVRQGGETTDVIETGIGAFACMLGGSDGRSLYVCLAQSTDGSVTRRIEMHRGRIPHADLPQESRQLSGFRPTRVAKHQDALITLTSTKPNTFNVSKYQGS